MLVNEEMERIHTEPVAAVAAAEVEIEGAAVAAEEQASADLDVLALLDAILGVSEDAG